MSKIDAAYFRLHYSMHPPYRIDVLMFHVVQVQHGLSKSRFHWATFNRSSNKSLANRA